MTVPDRPNIFAEEQRGAVCRGLNCPKCLGTDITHTGSCPDGMNLNNGFRCNTCLAMWEGY